MNPLIKMLQAARGTGLTRPLRKRAFKDMRASGKGYATGNLSMSQLAEDELDKILEFMNTSRYENPFIDDLLHEITNMYRRGKGR
jgi:hypothetical protein